MPAQKKPVKATKPAKKSVKKPAMKKPVTKKPATKKSLPAKPKQTKFKFDEGQSGTSTTTVMADPAMPKPVSLAQHLSKKSEPGTAPHVIVIARAGTGKTTTLIEGLKYMKGLPVRVEPSPQQLAVWEAMAMSRDHVKTVNFCAFNNSIAEELKSRVPEGCDAMTIHSLGYKSVKKAFPLVQRPNKFRVQDILADLKATDIRELRRSRPAFVSAVEDLVALCKQNLAGPCHLLEPDEEYNSLADRHEMEELADHYDIELNGLANEVYDTVPQIIERCKDVVDTVDFNDMVWLPVALNLPMFTYDMCLVDEAQDLNRCQKTLTLRAGKRLIYCGDPKQSIYGFAGADTDSMPNLESELSRTKVGCKVLPLTVTRRCGKAIVNAAKELVPDFEAFPTNPTGSIERMSMETYRKHCCAGEMVLCRVNAPLISECFKFLKENRKAVIQGRDIGQGLLRLIDKLMKRTPDGSVLQLIKALDQWHDQEISSEGAKKNPSDSRLITINDKYDCLMTFSSDAITIDEVKKRINDIFTNDETEGIRLSSVHKAKGLEARRVFILQPKGATMPHPMAKLPWEKEQELNILYVAITRAIEELVYVS